MSICTAALPAPTAQHRAGAPRVQAASTTTASTAARGIVSRLTRLVAALLMVTAVLACLVAVGAHLLGYRATTMLTGSMAPTIGAGDILVATQQPADQVQVGDVISYHIPVEDHRVQTHRVIEVIPRADGTTAVRTQGDANTAADPWTATLDGNQVWQVQTVVPHVGTLTANAVVQNTLLYGVLALLLGWILVSIRRRQN